MPELKRYVTETRDFPQAGILFRDLSPLLRNHFPAMLDQLEALLSEEEWRGVDAVAGIDARGFALGAALAARRALGFVPIRKAGKLPPPVRQLAYALEYGQASLEMHSGQGRLLLVDDIYATGGTLRAAAELCLQTGYSLKAVVVFADLRLGAEARVSDLPVRSVIAYG